MAALAPHRPRRPVFWTDLRFFAGIALILLSVGGVWLIVDAATRTSPVFAAARTLVPGDAVTAEDVIAVEAVLGASAGAYVAPGDLAPGSVVTRTVDEGELLPTGALAREASARHTSVVIANSAPVPSAVAPGAVVELWAAPRGEGGGYGTPSILVADATVASVTASSSMVGAGAADVELVIPRSAVAATLEAIAAGAALSVVPSALSVLPSTVAP